MAEKIFETMAVCKEIMRNMKVCERSRSFNRYGKKVDSGTAETLE